MQDFAVPTPLPRAHSPAHWDENPSTAIKSAVTGTAVSTSRARGKSPRLDLAMLFSRAALRPHSRANGIGTAGKSCKGGTGVRYTSASGLPKVKAAYKCRM